MWRARLITAFVARMRVAHDADPPPANDNRIPRSTVAKAPRKSKRARYRWPPTERK
jgi:hypothetical protein